MPISNIEYRSIKPGPLLSDFVDFFWMLNHRSEKEQEVTVLPQQNGSWKMDFKNGTSALADIVIGADGMNANIRPYITPIKPFYSGYTAVEGAVYHSETASPKVHKLLSGGKIFAMGDNKTLIVSSKGDGSLVFYTGCKMDEHWIREAGINFSDKAQVFG